MLDKLISPQYSEMREQLKGFIAVSDPLQMGWDLLGTAFYEPSIEWLAPSLLWTAMFVAVVGGHVLGAWSGHLGAERDARDGMHVRRDQVPLAVLMVGLTTLTLWSLGQAVIVSQEDGAPPTAAAALARPPGPAPGPASGAR